MSTPDLMTPEVAEQRRGIVALARDFAAREIAPHAAEWDRARAMPREVLAKLAELGFFGMRIPEQHGGLGLDALTYLMVLEELAAADASVSITLGVHNSLGCGMLCRHGSALQKTQWLPRMASGKIVGAFALSEPDAGSDPASLRAEARRAGEGWVLTGTKSWVTSGDLAGLLVVMARTDTPEARRGGRGISAFLVPGDAPGVEHGKAEDKMGLRASRTTGFVMHDVRVGHEALLGEEGKGLAYALGVLDQGRLGVAAQAVGIARAALEWAVKYSAERQQFGRPIKEFQGIQFKLADMATRVAAARALLHETAQQELAGGRRAVQASMTKLFASETAMWVTTQAVQVFGGYGYMRDYPVERLFRDAKVTEIYEGTSEIQRIVIARGLFG
ncbi:MAG: acyl-CoA dehydrogenase family protein [Gemmatimonadetes bacterium]|nr:acyl-CoA dehydrogenase family protein [Gemmatimonadota bacterium]